MVTFYRSAVRCWSTGFSLLFESKGSSLKAVLLQRHADRLKYYDFRIILMPGKHKKSEIKWESMRELEIPGR